MKKKLQTLLLLLGITVFSVIQLWAQTNTCPVPAGLTSSNITHNSATVSWGAVTGAAGYTVQYKPVTVLSWLTLNVSANTANLTGLLANTTYEYKVRTVCIATSSPNTTVVSDYSPASQFTTLAPPPCPVPTGLVSSNITQNSATVSWAAVSGAVGYTVQYKTAAATTWTTISVTTNSANLTGLLAGTAYQWKVRTVCLAETSANAGVYSDFSPVAQFTTLAATTCPVPTGLVSSNITQNSATVGWAAVAGAVGYTVQYKTAAATTWTTISVTTNSANLTGLLAGTAYQWKVRTVCVAETPANAGVYSDFSPVAQFTTLAATTCPVPTGLVSSNITQNSATVGWAAVAGAVGYTVQYKTAAATTWTTISVTTNSANLTGLLAGTAYQWKVRTVCAAEAAGTPGVYSAYSATAQFTTLAPASCLTPAGLASSNITYNSATVSWTAVSGAVGYTVQYKPLAATTWTTINVLTNTANLVGLLSNTTYEYKVRTVCVAASLTNAGVYSDYSPALQFTTLTAPSCPTPTGLVSSNITYNSATVSWAAVPGAVGYTVQYKPSAAIAWITLNVTTNTAILGGLLSSTAYQYKVRTVCIAATSTNTGVYSDYSAVAEFTTLAAPPPVACPMPTGLTSSNITQNSATVSWTAVAGAAGYTVQYKPVSAAAWISLNVLSNSANLAGLLPGTTYEYKVKTVCAATSTNSGSSSDFSPALQFTTLPASNSNKTGISEVSDIVVYPNPANELFNLELSETAQLQLADISGQVVYAAVKEAGLHTIEVGHLPAGIYVLTLTTANGKQTLKVVVQ